MRLGQTSVVYFISSILTSVIGFLATIYFTRTLGEEVYGYYALTLALVSWLGMVKTIGFGNAIVKRMSEDEEADAYLTAGIFLKGSLTILVASGVLIFNNSINEYIGQPVSEFVVLLLIATIFSGLVNSALKGTHRVHIYAPLGTGKELSRSIIMVSLVFFGWGLTGMLTGYVVGTVVIATIGLLIVRPTITMPEWRHIVSLFDYGKYAWLGSIRKKANNDVDLIVLGFFAPAGLTGIYAVSWTLAQFLDIFGAAIKNTLFPEMSKLDTEGNRSMVGTLTSDALAYAGLFLIPGTIGAAILGDRLMRVYGPGFEQGEEVLVILILGLLSYTFTKQLLNSLNAIDRPDLAFRANGLFILSNLVLNIALVWKIGWVGAAIATASAATIGLAASIYYARQHINFQIPIAEIGRQTSAAVLMGIAVYGARIFGETHQVSNYNTVFVISLVSFGAIVYFCILLILSNRLRTTIRRNLPFTVPLFN